MEKILFKKIELWVLGVLAVFGFFGMVLFGAIVLDEERGEEELGGDHFGVIGDAALALAELPENARQSLRQLGRPDPTMIVWRGADLSQNMASGWSWYQPPASSGLNGFLLNSRYDGNVKRQVIELMSLKTGETLKTWSPKAETLLAAAEWRPEFDGWTYPELWTNTYFRYVHPYLTTAGELLLKDHNTPLFLVSPCGDIQWVNDDFLFHHSTEPDGEGGFWIPSLMLKDRPKDLSNSFVREALVRVNSEGEVVYQKALDEILIANGLRHLLFPATGFFKDPMHLNDIQPIYADGPFWKKGDLFLSLRTPSLVLLYRPSTQKIIWSQAGPWMSQHDVDIVDDHRIAVFSNNAYDEGLGPRVAGPSETLIYDFETGVLTSPFRKTLKELNVITLTEGLQDFAPSGHVIFEEADRGRILLLDGKGKLVASFLNRAENGQVYALGWSRYIPQAHGDKALAAIEQSGC